MNFHIWPCHCPRLGLLLFHSGAQITLRTLPSPAFDRQRASLDTSAFGTPSLSHLTWFCLNTDHNFCFTHSTLNPSSNPPFDNSYVSSKKTQPHVYTPVSIHRRAYPARHQLLNGRKCQTIRGSSRYDLQKSAGTVPGRPVEQN